MDYMDIKEKRRILLTAQKVRGKNLVNVLADLLLAYPPRDLRLEEGGVEALDMEYVQDLVNSMRVITSRKQFDTGIVYLDYKFVTNLVALKTYNETVDAYNDAYFSDEGKTEDQILSEDLEEYDRDFDYTTGGKRTNTKRITPVIPDNQFEDDVTVPVNAPGAFGANRPSPMYATKVSVQYQVRLDGDLFTLSYVARDMDNRVLYYDEASSTNLTDLVRRSVQRLWGNPVINLRTFTGYFYDGVFMLLHGKKTRYCAGTKPGILNKGERLLKVNVELAKVNVAESLDVGLARLIGGVGPVICVIAWIGYILYWVNQYDLDTGVFPEGSMTCFLIGLAILVAVSILVNKAATGIYRNAGRMHRMKKLL